jgi:hypothetical protein
MIFPIIIIIIIFILNNKNASKYIFDNSLVKHINNKIKKTNIKQNDYCNAKIVSYYLCQF